MLVRRCDAEPDESRRLVLRNAVRRERIGDLRRGRLRPRLRGRLPAVLLEVVPPQRQVYGLHAALRSRARSTGAGRVALLRYGAGVLRGSEGQL